MLHVWFQQHSAFLLINPIELNEKGGHLFAQEYGSGQESAKGVYWKRILLLGALMIDDSPKSEICTY